MFMEEQNVAAFTIVSCQASFKLPRCFLIFEIAYKSYS
jgi:hypothetical protein